TYTWSDGFVGVQNTSLYAGNHYVVAEDEIGCSDTVYFIVTEPDDKLELFLDSIIPVRCKGMSIGEAYLSSEYGIAPITYDWSDGGSGLTRIDLPAQNYEVIA